MKPLELAIVIPTFNEAGNVGELRNWGTELALVVSTAAVATHRPEGAQVRTAMGIRMMGRPRRPLRCSTSVNRSI